MPDDPGAPPGSPGGTLHSLIRENFLHRLVEDYPAQIRRCLEGLDDEEIWWRPHPEANAIGNLVLHLCGNVRHYLWLGVGGDAYERDRPREFEVPEALSGKELLSLLDATAARAREILDDIEAADLTRPSRATEYEAPVYELLYHVATHFAYHTGQIVYATKLLREEGFAPELWRETTRAR